MSRRRARWLAVPLATFAVVFGASFAYHSLTGETASQNANAEPGTPAAEGGQRIAVSIRSDRVGESYLYTVSLDGSNLERITRPPSEGASVNDGFAAWSPDGEEIALVRQVIEDPANPAEPNIYTISPDGSGLRQLTKGRAFDLLPAWSPDGSRIAFSRVIDERSTDVFTMNRDGGDLRQLTTDIELHEDFPSWSPDGQQIVYTSVRENEDLWVMNADGSDKQLLLGGPHEDGSADFSPDGATIAFIRDGHVALMAGDGSDVRLLTDGGRADSNPQWSPDGVRILFTRDPGEVYVMNADGSGVARVPFDGQAGGASWGPAE